MAHTVVCTICSGNYLAQARTLMASLREVHPDWDQHVLIVDSIGEAFDRAAEPFSVSEISQLPIPDVRRLSFRYTILELNTAVKPIFLRWLFEREDTDRVVYLDPDILVFQPLSEVVEALDSGALMCLTPHLTDPLWDDKKPSEIDIMRAGAYNLGFIAVARHRDLDHFLGWWEARTEKDCVVDFSAGLFLDQRWIDLVPGMYEDVWLIRNEGYNVAYWNLAHRGLHRVAGDIWVNGHKLAFFHFSGLDPLNPDPFSKHQDRFTLGELGSVVTDLVDDYRDALFENGHAECSTWPYTFSCFRDGEPIADEVRALYRRDAAVQEAGGKDPFELGHAYFNEPWGTPDAQPLVSRLMHSIWLSRPDLQLHFPDPDAANRLDFAYWFLERIAAEHDLPDCYLGPLRESLSSRSGSRRARRAIGLRRLARRLRFLTRRLPPSVADRLRALQRPAIPAGSRRSPGPAIALVPGMDFAGFYPQDEPDRREGAAWMGASAQLRLGEWPAKKVWIEGEHHAGLHQSATGDAGVGVALAVDGAAIGEIRLEKGGAFSEGLDIDRPLGAESVLSISSNRTVVPSEMGAADDPRELSLRISRIRVGDEVVLDFAAEGRPYRVERSRSVGPLGINVVGYLRSELGVGESARLCALAAKAGGIDFDLVDFSFGCSSRAGDLRWEADLANDSDSRGRHPVNVIHINADQLPVAYGHLGAEFFADRYNVGVWHWELPEFPDQWLGSYEMIDELWAPSRMVMETLSQKSPVPIVYMPHAISFEAPADAQRRRFGLPSDRFLFLCMYDMHSSQARKNPEASIAAFREAFPSGDSAGLVIKIMNGDQHPEDLAVLRRRLRDLPSAFLIEETLARDDVYRLESVCDCFVSLHRSEGFGLGLAESMYLGKPVIGTAWSGNVDFMTPENSCPVRYELVTIEESRGPYEKGQRWAEPDREHAAWFMRKLVDDESFRNRIASAGQRTIRTEHSPESIGRRYRQRLEWITRRS